MASRRLTEQQRRRLKANQAKKANAALTHSHQRPGLIVAHTGKHLIVRTSENILIHCKIRQNIGTLVTGDEVVWQPTSEHEGVVIAVQPRKNLIQRLGSYQKHKALAANISQLLIVCATTPEPFETTIDRYLVLAHHLDVKPIVICNKWDLLNSNHDWLLERLDTYQALGYKVIKLSAHNLDDTAQLLPLLAHERSILVGQSGVGKSTLLNLLIPNAQAETGNLSKLLQGMHTTTATRLYELKAGAELIDSPGIRQFSLSRLSISELVLCFPELHQHAHLCPFRNCRHLDEKDCYLLDAAKTGIISPFRLSSYQTILKEWLDN